MVFDISSSVLRVHRHFQLGLEVNGQTRSWAEYILGHGYFPFLEISPTVSLCDGGGRNLGQINDVCLPRSISEEAASR